MRLTRDGLLQAYHSYGVPEEKWRVGAEFERHILDRSGQPLPYYGTPGVRWLLNTLVERDGWVPTLEDGHPIALSRDGARVTLEPGGQLELSGAPFASVIEVDAELHQFNLRIEQLLEGTNYHQVALGFTPFAAIESIPWVPKGRYVIMRDYLQHTGTLAHHMMKGTCATQASYDFSDEKDCARKVQLAVRLGPLTTAMFANSPIAEGRDTGFASWRGHIWTQTDPRRTGFPAASSDFTFERWIDYLLDVPMMFIHRGDEYVWAKGRTFRDWMTDKNDPPTEHDWELHLTSVFPEIRIKQTIEVRGADCVSRPLAMAFTALYEGLFYCTRSQDLTEELSLEFNSMGTKEERFDIACRQGLAGTIGDRKISSWVEELLEIAGPGLDRCRPGDRRFLRPLEELVQAGESLSTAVVADLKRLDSPADFVLAHGVE